MSALRGKLAIRKSGSNVALGSGTDGQKTKSCSLPMAAFEKFQGAVGQHLNSRPAKSPLIGFRLLLRFADQG